MDYVRNVPVRPRRHARLTQWVPSAAIQRYLLGALPSRRRTVSRAPDDGISVLGSRHMFPKTRRPAYVAHCHGPSSSNSLPARPSPPRPQALRAMLRAIRRPPRRVRPRAGRSATQPLGACYLPVDETGGNSNSAPRPPQTPASPANGTVRRCVGAKARSHPRGTPRSDRRVASLASARASVGRTSPFSLSDAPADLACRGTFQIDAA